MSVKESTSLRTSAGYKPGIDHAISSAVCWLACQYDNRRQRGSESVCSVNGSPISVVAQYRCYLCPVPRLNCPVCCPQVVKWFGMLRGRGVPSGTWVGVELTAKDKNSTNDGVAPDKRRKFRCDPGRALFLPASKFHPLILVGARRSGGKP